MKLRNFDNVEIDNKMLIKLAREAKGFSATTKADTSVTVIGHDAKGYVLAVVEPYDFAGDFFFSISLMHSKCMKKDALLFMQHKFEKREEAEKFIDEKLMNKDYKTAESILTKTKHELKTKNKSDSATDTWTTMLGR